MPLSDREAGEIITTLKNFKDDLTYLRMNMDALGEKLEKKFASKWVEKFTLGVITFVVLALVSAAIYSLIPSSHVPEAHAIPKGNTK